LICEERGLGVRGLTMEFNVINKSQFSSNKAFARLDAEYAWRSLVEAEFRLRKLSGFQASDVTTRYSGPTVNDLLMGGQDLISYAAIDGLTYADDILFLWSTFWG
jgi:hypothetical protein